MTLHHLEVFSEVCHLESITLAAERLHMSQPAVSTIIKDLERFYGVRLFDRMNRRIYITQSGSMLYNYAQSILSQLDDVKELLSENADLGSLRIGSNIAFAYAHLGEIIAEFKKTFAGISIYTRVQNPEHLADSLLHNELDFAIADKSLFSEQFCFERLTRDQVTLVCSHAFAKEHFPDRYVEGGFAILTELAEIAKLPILLREVGSGSRENMDEVFRSAGLTPKIAAESISGRVLMNFCRNGLGITTAPHSQKDHSQTDPEVIELVMQDAAIYRDYYLIYHKNKYFTYGMQLFLDHLRNNFADHKFSKK